MDFYLIELISLVLLAILMGYLSAISSAYVSLKIEDINDNNKKLKKKNKKLKNILKKEAKFVRAMDMGITFCELCISAVAVEVIATPIYRKYVYSVSMPAIAYKYLLIFGVTFLVTYFIFMFADLLPRHIGVRHSKLIAYSTIDILYVLAFIFSPIAIILHKTDDFFVKAFEKTNQAKSKFTDAELRSILELNQELGVVSKETKALMDNVISLDDIPVSKIMKDIDKLKALDVEFSREKVIELVKKYNQAHIPVYDRDPNNILGIVGVKKIFQEEDAEVFRLEKMITPILIVSDRKKVAPLLKEMRKEKIKMAIVQNDEKKNIGFLKVADIANYLVQNTTIKEEE